jgi:hypothetical protein
MAAECSWFIRGFHPLKGISEWRDAWQSDSQRMVSTLVEVEVNNCNLELAE